MLQIAKHHHILVFGSNYVTLERETRRSFTKRSLVDKNKKYDPQASRPEINTLTIIIESTEDRIWGRWESSEDIVVSSGADLTELKTNLAEVVNLYLEEINQAVLNIENVNFKIHVDPENPFGVNDYINISLFH